MNSFDPQEVERLVDTYSDTVLRLSYSYLRSVQDAEDICQTVFLKLLTAGTVFASPAHEKAFIIRATINACKNELKAVRRRLLPLDEAAAGTAPEPPATEVLDAVMELPPKYRAAIYLFYYEGYAIGEMAQLLGCSEAAAAARLSRGRKRLRAVLGGDYEQRLSK
ncbi:MAG: sigma-70 family RNA polymerase sigma factor [Firmicutes bacterium]|nr:sigma-70 family RNA polymerase sigma factor [Bacillota bacterium]